MPVTAQALRYHDFGDPLETVRLDSIELPDPGPGEVLLRMEAAPLNPADLNVLEGTYPMRDAPPAVPGLEGCGTVIAVGPNAPADLEGRRVVAPGQPGNWCSHRLLPAEHVIVIPDAVPVEQAAMLSVNPPTAWRMLHDFVACEPGDWIIQNAANSGVGVSVIQLAKALGLRTVNLVRRPELIPELEALGADVVVVDGPNAPAEIGAATGKAPIRLGLNATGGDALRTLVRCLGEDATVVTYGAMSREPFTLSNGALIFRNLTATGFWISRWFKQAPPEAIRDMMAPLLDHAAAGVLAVPVAQTYALNEWQQALEHAARPQRAGKILFSATA